MPWLAATQHVLPRFISVSGSSAQFLHLNEKKLWKICNRGVLLAPQFAGHELFSTFGFFFFGFASFRFGFFYFIFVILTRALPVKSSKHDVRCLIFFIFYIFSLFL